MLTLTQKHIIPIVAFTAIGNIEKLKTALNQSLDAGLTINEAKEVLVQTYAYAGFPRSINGLVALMDVVKQRQALSKHDVVGKDVTPLHDDRTMLAIGTEIQTKLVGQPVTGPLYAFAPAIDQFLKSHLFGDIFVRDILDYPTREVATIAILATLNGAEAQLSAHYQIGRNSGLSTQDLHEIVDVLHQAVSAEIGNRAEQVLQKL